MPNTVLTLIFMLTEQRKCDSKTSVHSQVKDLFRLETQYTYAL